MKPELGIKLHDAAKQVEAVAGQLDRTVSNCGQCSAPRWANRDEYQMGIELDAVTQKLRRFAQKLGIESNSCAVCGVPGPEHGHWSATDPATHKFVSLRREAAPEVLGTTEATAAPQPVTDALGNLLQWAIGNRGSRDGNPYHFPEVKAALRALATAKGWDEEQIAKNYFDAADEYRTKTGLQESGK
jgi:hypothetical protein